IVFDPTAQWSGFLKPNRNKKMLKTYRQFNMKVSTSKAFNGNIYEIKDAREMIDIKKYMTPGEITVFTMNHLDTKDIDFFVANTVKQVFHANLEESQRLKLLIVYDEVHRLLEKYGGTGDGFIQIERAAREFRKWGIGLVLISQVLSDFIGTIKANIGTDIQLRTRDEHDLDRIKTKYGDDMMRSVVKASVGEGMLENAAYNKGKPYFVSFRPLLHEIERLSDDILEKYSKYNARIDDLKYQLECLKAEAIDIFDLDLELKLTLDSLKKGKFNMIEIYLDGLEPKIAEQWKKIGKTPKKRIIAYASREDIQKDIDKAKVARDDYLDSLKFNVKKSKKEDTKDDEDDKDDTDATDDELPKKPSGDTKPEKSQEQSRKDELDMIRRKVTESIQDKARKEDKKKGINRPSPHKKAKIHSVHLSSTEKKVQHLDNLYNNLKEKISEQNREGKDTSLVRLRSMSIPSDIKLALASDNSAGLAKVESKINVLLKSLD
ncbi:MAG: ATP-binding protein, partial [Candidatus Aenigmarchaeota archaeon]|nr:ATP-binding protein [Candidatus Aenigmarchaeota archaeon]